MATTSANDERELQLKVTLHGSKPPIWRRLVVPESLTLSELHDAIQVAMNWENYHLYAFSAKGETYSLPNADWPSDDLDASSVTLRDLRLRRPGTKFTYNYDFGDDWLHDIVVEAVAPLDLEAKYPRCLGGRRAAPPEDCGGIYGYARMLAIADDPEHPEHAEIADWLPDAFDPATFDLEDVNRMMRRIFKGR